MRLLGTFFLFSACFIFSNCSQEQQTVDNVDPFIGTGFHGHTFPGAVVPFGRVQLSPDTHLLGWDASSGYHYADTTLYGFSHTHLSGTGIGDMGDILFLPFTGDIPEENPVADYRHQNEHAEPGYYTVSVMPWNVKAELTATIRTGWHRYSFPRDEQANIMVDLSHVLQTNWGHRLIECEMTIVDEYTVEGYRLTTGWAEHDPIWFRVEFDAPIIGRTILVDGLPVEDASVAGREITAFFTFDKSVVQAVVAVSAVDAKGAQLNLEAEANDQKFASVAAAARDLWQQELIGIEIETDNQDVKTTFYTALYHSKIFPMVFDDIDGRYRGMDRQIHDRGIGTAYTVYSLWDTFRSWYPLMTITEPERAREWAYSLYQHAVEGGLLPKWALNGNYTGTMVGYPATAILGDAFVKGFIDEKADELLTAAVKSSTWQADFVKKHKGKRAERVMPRHIYYKEKYGFVPVDKVSGSVSYGLEMAYYDWCVSQMARTIGNSEIADEYAQKGLAYREYFDAKVGFMRGKKLDGQRPQNFNPRYSDHESGDYVEGNAWQWTPFVPHDVDGFAELLGGKAALGVWLDSLFTTSSIIEGERASGDITGLIGQYAHGNEPSHHVPFLYQWSDRPWRTQEVVDYILSEFYSATPEGIIGNEDCGQMSAWYVLNAVGIYQVAPGKTEMTIGRPIVDKARIRTGDGWFTIVVHNNAPENKYLEKAVLNGTHLDEPFFDFSDIKSGATLELTMSEVRP
jgi:predicted alpha-1,2-mannosidase